MLLKLDIVGREETGLPVVRPLPPVVVGELDALNSRTVGEGQLIVLGCLVVILRNCRFPLCCSRHIADLRPARGRFLRVFVILDQLDIIARI